ncbi:MAG TPA: hypothetical protein VM925_01525 [Labilithrix sp.]|nr:hypothetical protein [Labilithrix sp.]
MDNLPIVIGVVLVVAVLAYFLFFRKKALPEPTAKTPGPAPSPSSSSKSGASASEPTW